MSTLQITEFRGTATIKTSVAGVGGLGAPSFAGLAPVAQTPPLVYQDITFTSSSVQCSAFSADTHLVRVISDADCCLDFGANPTAIPRGTTGTTLFMKANVPEYFGVLPSQLLAAIASS